MDTFPSIVLIAFTVATSAFIAFQDFSFRAINIWLLACFCILNLALSLFQHQLPQLLENFAFSGAYIALIVGVTKLYLLGSKRKETQVTSAIGPADIILLASIGGALQIQEMVSFCTVTFAGSLLVHKLVSGRDRHVPLAAYLSIFYSLLLIYNILARSSGEHYETTFEGIL